MWWDLPRFGVVLPCLFVLGICIGSFLNVCIHRFPSRVRLGAQLRSLAAYTSGCPRCLSSIQWHDNIPILGWLFLRGRCRNCRQPVSGRYPLVELLTGIVFVLLYQFSMPASTGSELSTSGLYHYGGPQIVSSSQSDQVWLHLRYALHAALLCSLIVAAFIDWELQVIPDGCTLPLMLIAPLAAWICGQTWIVPLWFQDSSVVRTLRPVLPDWLQPLMFDGNSLAFAQQHPHWHALLVSLCGLLTGGILVWLVRVIGVFALRQEAMGFGDVTLMAMIGSVIGWQPVTFVFLLAPVMAVFAAAFSWIFRRNRELPYGPWLSLATLLLLLCWKWLWPLAERVFDMGPLVLLLALVMTVCLAASLQLIQLVKKFVGAGCIDRPLTFRDLEEVRALRRWLGRADTEPVFDDGGWTSADHLSYYNAGRPEAPGSSWPRETWPGCRSGQGQTHWHRWRTGGR